MQVVELVYVILTLLIEVLVDVILIQLLKATSEEMTTRPGSHRVIATRKLYHLAGPTYSGALV